MKFYSEVTKKLYDSADDLNVAEAKIAKQEEEARAIKKAKDEARAARAKEVDAAYNNMVKARKNYQDLLAKFTKDFGAYHMTIKSSDLDWDKIFDNLTDYFF